MAINFTWDFAAEREREARAAEQRAAVERLAQLMELSALRPPGSRGDYMAGGRPGGGADELIVNFADPDPGLPARLPVMRSDQFRRAGLDEGAVAEAAGERLRTAQRAAAFEALRGNPFAQAAMAVDRAPQPPYTLNQTGTLNRYSGEVAYAPAHYALEAERATAAEDTMIRMDAAREFLDAGVTDPTVLADFANRRPVSDTELVQVQRPDGSTYYADRARQADGTYSYTPAAAPGGELLDAPAGTVQDSAQAFNIRNLARIYGVPEQEAAELILSSRAVSPQDAWPEYVKLVARSAVGGYGRNAQRVEEMARGLFRIAYPDAEPPGAADATTPTAGTRGTRGTAAAPRPAAEAAPPRRPPRPPRNAAPPQRRPQDARIEALNDGYEYIGEWVPGRGWEIFDARGNLRGYYD